ncbi:type IV toxin-antitoxin system AbiEi family antitoxin [Porticoccus sp. GXU_MW_L64]
MKTLDIVMGLNELDKAGQYVFTKSGLKNCFYPNVKKPTFERSLERLVEKGVLKRAARGVYVNPHTRNDKGYTIELVAKALREGEYSYVSLESALSEYGVISQIPVDRLTLMTTGRKGVIKTPYGIIEFTHTAKSRLKILQNIVTIPDRPLRVARVEQAYSDLKRVGRNVDMVDAMELSND